MKEIIRKTKKYGILFLVAVLMIYSAALINYSFSSIDREGKKVVTVDIPTGSGFLQIAEILTREGIVRNRVFFYSLAVIKRAIRTIRAGEYEFSTSMTPLEVINKLIRGEIKIYRVTIPEDFSLKEIAERLAYYKLIHEEDFFDLAEDEDFLQSLNIEAASLEGYLFPDTYFFNRSTSTRQILRTMVNRFWKKVTPEMIAKAKSKGFNLHEFVTFASIVGRESGNSEEKPLIAAVFANRMKKKMPLQSDPTAVYDLENFNGKILRSHLKRKSPYNTYIIVGLPPGPIANPGIDSLKAALDPAPVDYLYFVSKRDGSHFFSSSLTEHNEAVYRLRSSKKSNPK